MSDRDAWAEAACRPRSWVSSNGSVPTNGIGNTLYGASVAAPALRLIIGNYSLKDLGLFA